jgi:pyridoxal phosphate enzyme (YggS family)
MSETASGAPTDVDARIERIRARVTQACERAGRSRNEVTIVAVSKFQPLELVTAAYIAGQRDFGENYAQELRDKAAALPSVEGVRWHVLSHVEGGDLNTVAKHATLFHSLTSVEVGQALGKLRLHTPLDCLVEVDVANEGNKRGLSDEREIARLVERTWTVDGIKVIGLMCAPSMAMPPQSTDPAASRPHFDRMRELAKRLGLPQLSMGTTDDFEVAIEAGATIVRIGRSIFGTQAAQVKGTPFEHLEPFREALDREP